MLSRLNIPGLIVVGTDTGVGKTLVTGAIADWFQTRGRRVAVCKPVATGCVHRREGLVSEDSEFLAHCAEARHPLHLICPQRYAEPLAPAVAAERAGQPVDFGAIDSAIQWMSRDADVMLVEGVGGVMVPLDNRTLLLDAIHALEAPVVVVARAALGTINHTLLTLHALRSRGVRIAGVVINRYHPDPAPIVEETSPRQIEKHGRVPILCIVPEDKVTLWGAALAPPLPAGVVAAVGQVDWESLAARAG